MSGEGGKRDSVSILVFHFFPFYYLPTRSFVHYINFAVVLFNLFVAVKSKFFQERITT